MSENALEEIRDEVFGESEFHDLVFDLAYRALTDAAGDVADSQEKFDELMEAPHFGPELDAMIDRIYEAVEPRRCVCCGDPTGPVLKTFVYKIARFFRRIWPTKGAFLISQ